MRGGFNDIAFMVSPTNFNKISTSYLTSIRDVPLDPVAILKYKSPKKMSVGGIPLVLGTRIPTGSCCNDIIKFQFLESKVSPGNLSCHQSLFY